MAAAANKKKPGSKTIASNRKAYHEYEVLDSLRAGIVLTGTEIKSIRAGKVTLNQGFAKIVNGEVLLYGMNIQTYGDGSYNNHDPFRVRKLLLKKSEINKLSGKIKQSGLTLVPLKLYFSRCWVKVELGLCQGKKQYDKRETIKAKENKRELARALKYKNR